MASNNIFHFPLVICALGLSASPASFRKRTCPPRAAGGTSAPSKRLGRRTSPLSKRCGGGGQAQCANDQWKMENVVRRHGLTDPVLNPRRQRKTIGQKESRPC